MSKSFKPSYKEIVEIVENLLQLLSYISTTLSFWKLDTIFPGNLIKDCCNRVYDETEKIIKNI